LLIGVLLAIGCGEDSPPPSPRPSAVLWDEARSAGEPTVRRYSGVVQADTATALAFEVAGRVDSVLARVGESVRAGAVLATLDADDYLLQAREAAAAVSAAAAARENAEQRYRRLQALWEHGNASEQDLEAAEAAYESAQARWRAARQRHRLARRQVADTRLHAPYAADVAAVPVEVGAMIAPGHPVVLLLARGRLEVHLAVPAAAVSRLVPGQEATVVVSALADTLAGEIAEVGVAPAGFATTYPVTVAIPSHAAVRPGMTAEVSLALAPDDPTTVLVPAAAVGEDQEGRHVYVLAASPGDSLGTVERRDVQVGALRGRTLEIHEGLRAGERVVVAGLAEIGDGQRVRPRRRPAP
jgi:RND family efflux transporter MFP subunit